ncbi:superoxide dismutase family protein [Micromonosporaceae bacterium Da 78-11]
MMTRLLVLIAPVALTAACANSIEIPPLAASSGVTTSASAWTIYQGSPSPTRPGTNPLTPGTEASGTFLPYRPGSTAITYDPAVVPPGATATVTITKTAYGTVVRLTAGGLVPRRAYGAHLHTQPCTAVPDAAGPHYQHMHDPKTPSVDPSFANPTNEVWLDFTADSAGSAAAVSDQDWTLDPTQPPRSLIVHTARTNTASGVAGTAGARVACLTLP